MKNLTKNSLLLIIIFPLIILLSSFSVDKASAQQSGNCYKIINRGVSSWKCRLSDLNDKIFTDQNDCNSVCVIAAPTPTKTPTPTPTFTTTGSCSHTDRATCEKSGCLWAYHYLIPSGYCTTKSSAPTPIPTSAPTPTPSPATSQLTPEQCSSHCGARTDCAQCPDGNFICGTTDINQCSDSVPAAAPTQIPAPRLVWQGIAVCPAPTAAPIPRCKIPSDCNNPPQCQQTANAKCDNGTCVYSAVRDGTQCLLVSGVNGSCLNGACKEGAPTKCEGNADGFSLQCTANGCSPGQREQSKYTCSSGQFCCGTALPTSIPTAAPIPTLNPALTPSCPINDANVFCSAASPGTSCGLLYSVQTANCPLPNQCWRCAPTPAPVSQCVASDCGLCAVGSSCQQVAGTSTKQCACQSSTPTSAPTPTSIPTATPTITPTPTPVPTPLPGSVQLALSVAQQGLTSTPLNINRQVTVILKGADGQTTTKTGTVTYSGGTFNGTINLGILPNGTYKSKVKVGNFLKSFTADLVISGTTANAETKVIAGLDDQDDVDAILFYNGLRACFGSNIGVKKCDKPQDIDLNGDGNVDIIDYQIYLKGIRNLKLGLPV